MKISTAALSVATLSLAMLVPAFGQTPASGSQDTQTNTTTETQHMVRARASLTHALDANSVHDGDQFRATLTDNVHLADGVELHHGDTLIGKVVTDDTNATANSRLAVRFTEADLKSGKTIPIKATIVALYNPDDLMSNADAEPAPLPNSWSDGTLHVDQIGVVKDVDLHSRISSQNSGVFVSTRKNFKIPSGSEFALAIAPQAAAPTNPGD